MQNTPVDDSMTTIVPERSKRLQSWLRTTSQLILAGLTVFVLITSFLQIHSEVFIQYSGQLAVYAVLTTLSLYLGVLLTENELSPSHMFGIVAFLSLPGAVFPAMTWAIFIGASIGAVLLLVRARFQPTLYPQGTARFDTSLFIIIRIVLSFWAAGQLYLTIGGVLPIGRLSENSVRIALPLFTYSLLYITLYFSIFLLQLYIEGRAVTQITRTDLSRIASILLLPLPFAVLGAEVLSVLEPPSTLILMAGLVFIAVALYVLSLSEFRLRKQLNELRTLSVVTQAMRAHLNLDGLLRTIYVQVAHLLDIDNFMVALYDLNEQRLNFALVMRDGREEHQGVVMAEKYDDTLIGHVLKIGSPLLIADNVYTRTIELKLRPPDSSVTSWMGVPLQAGGRQLGVMIVMLRDPGRNFRRDDLRLLNIIAASSSIAIENAQLYQQQTERAEQLVTLNQVAALLSGTLSSKSVVETVISSASAISNAQAVALYMFWDNQRANLSLFESAGFSDDFAVDPPDPLIYARRDEPNPHLLAVTVENVATDRKAEPLREALLAENKTSFVELPLTRGDAYLGVLAVYYDQPQIFTGDKVELLKTFANQAAQAILNAEQYTSTGKALERTVEQLLSLADVNRLLTSTVDLRMICDFVLTHALDANKLEVGLVALVHEGAPKPVIMAERGYPEKTAQTVLKARVVQDALLHGKLYHSDDVDRPPVYPSPIPSTHSMLAVPITRGDDHLGVIVLESESLGAFSIEDSQFIDQIANQAVIAIENARLFARIAKDRDRLKVLLDAMEEGIMLINERGEVVMANPRIDLVSLSQLDVINQNLLDLIDEPKLHLIERTGFSSRQDARDLIVNMHINRIYQPTNYVVQGAYGALYIRRHIIPVRNESGATIGLLLVFYNKTEEEELSRSREELSRMIVHDLRSPLTAVNTSLKLLRDLVPMDSEYRPLVDTTTDASRRAIRKLLGRVDSLLDIAKMESGQLDIDTDLTELGTLFENVRSELYPLAQELEIEIKSDLPSELPLLNIDADKTERLLLNLVDNALKYSPRNSTITVRAQLPGTNGIKNGFIRIDVVDRGPGVPDEYKNNLFERFVQIEGRRKVRRGVGLGLTFCRMVTEAHGGRIWIEDNPEGGSIFSFTLPVATVGRFEDDF